MRHKITGEIEHELKLRGFTLDHATSKVINYHTFKTMVTENYETLETLDATYNRIQPSIKGHVKTIKCTKKYAPIFQKAFLGPDRNTIYPFGYKH
jgi:hypothetical protein